MYVHRKTAWAPRSKKFVYGIDPELCVVNKMKQYMDTAGLRVQHGCQKWSSPGSLPELRGEVQCVWTIVPVDVVVPSGDDRHGEAHP